MLSYSSVIIKEVKVNPFDSAGPTLLTTLYCVGIHSHHREFESLRLKSRMSELVTRLVFRVPICSTFTKTRVLRVYNRHFISFYLVSYSFVNLLLFETPFVLCHYIFYHLLQSPLGSTLP